MTRVRKKWCWMLVTGKEAGAETFTLEREVWSDASRLRMMIGRMAEVVFADDGIDYLHLFYILVDSPPRFVIESIFLFPVATSS